MSFPGVTAEQIPGLVFVCARASEGTGRLRVCSGTQEDVAGLRGVTVSSARTGRSVQVYGEDEVVHGFSGLVPGREYYLDAGGAIALSVSGWTRLVGVARTESALELRWGPAQQGSAPAAGSNAFRITAYDSSVAPASVAIRTWLDVSGTGDVSLPASAGLSALDACAVCTTDGGPIDVVTDGATINGEASFRLSSAYEQYLFFWTGSEWRIWG